MHDDRLGSRLRQERERRQIPLSTVAEKTKILGALLEGLERNDVSRWPTSGLYRRSFIRAYAVAVGLNPDRVVREFDEQFPDPAVAARALADVESGTAPAVASTNARAATSAATGDARPSLRLTLADTPSSFFGGRLIPLPRRRLAAVCCDAAVLLTIATAFLITIGEFWMPLSITIACYYLGGILILGNTPGVCLFAPLPGDASERSAWDDDAAANTGGLWRLIGHRTMFATGPDRRSDHESSGS